MNILRALDALSTAVDGADALENVAPIHAHLDAVYAKLVVAYGASTVTVMHAVLARVTRPPVEVAVC